MLLAAIKKGSFLMLFIAFSFLCFSQLKGKVVEIDNSDSFILLTATNQPIKIFLYEIDCPEKRQDYSNAATLRLSPLILISIPLLIYGLY